MVAKTANLLLHLRGNSEKAMTKNYKKQPTLSNLNLRQLNLKFHFVVITATQCGHGKGGLLSVLAVSGLGI